MTELQEPKEPFDLDKVLYGDGPNCFSHALDFHIDEKSMTDSSLTGWVKLEPHHCRVSPIGLILHGGLSLAIAESMAGLASHYRLWCLNVNRQPMGTAVTANHVSPAALGDYLLLETKLLHESRRTHIWDVTISNIFPDEFELRFGNNDHPDVPLDQDKWAHTLVSSIRVTNVLV